MTAPTPEQPRDLAAEFILRRQLVRDITAHLEEEFVPAITAAITAAIEAATVPAAPQPAPELPQLQLGPCPAGDHEGEHLQLRTHDHWLCAYALANMLAASGVTDDVSEQLETALARVAELERQGAKLLATYHATGSGHVSHRTQVQVARCKQVFGAELTDKEKKMLRA